MRSWWTSERSSAGRSFIAASFLIGLVAGCVSADPIRDVCPDPVWMDAPVAEELEDVPFEGHEDLYSWMSRIERLNEALEACRG